ncbi:DUF6689 family protein [Pseudidiomarina homiensis]|uniref:Uncharacterized protein n=1 Tax=Pseudidiomarina homiensis TaxID=364198 RepID=A0A432Y7B6_9GAMM|nr:DUF6689 family protein [Pseudidiomarina homiensis]RUO56864.1 hypothetical protein CWI70_09065 [Pseudidiomarina homiensis]
MLPTSSIKTVFGVVAALFFACSSMTSRAEVLDLTIQPQSNKVETSVQLTELIGFDLTITFENAVGLTAQNFTVNAQLIDLNDLTILNRLPDSLLTGIPSAFPVLISIEPDPAKGFSFSGAYEIELYTKSLHYTAGSPLRMFHSHNNGEFEDITTMTGSGSYRVRTNGGQFSDFIIVADLRDINTVISTKVNRLADYVDSVSHSLTAIASQTLSDAIASIEVALASGNYQQAQQATNALIQLMRADDGTLYPDVWRSAGDLENIRGRILSMANTLRYSLRIR